MSSSPPPPHNQHEQVDLNCVCVFVCTPFITGREPQRETLEKMVSESPGALNFTMFLSLFGDKLKGERYGKNMVTAAAVVGFSAIITAQ